MPGRVYTRDARVGKYVILKGWVEKIRDLGGLKFFILRDREGKIQVTLKKGEINDDLFWNRINRLGREYCVAVQGKVKSSRQAPGGREIIPNRIDVINTAASPLPIDIEGPIESNVDKRFDFRYLDVRNPKTCTIFRIRDAVYKHMRDYFSRTGAIEVHTPVIQAAGAEGGATLFPLIYYQKEAFLRQSPQLYKQMLMSSGFDRVWEIGQVFRAEKFHTRRHISEYVSVDAEIAWTESEEDVMKYVERLVQHTIKGVVRECREELDFLGVKLKVPKVPFPRLTYDECLKMLGKERISVQWGEDLGDPQEAKIGKIMEKKGHEWYFICKYPSKIKPFYIMFDGRLSRGMDLDFRGMEMASGGQREHRYDVLVQVMRDKGLDPDKFDFYLNAFRYGMPPHGGFGLGSERLVQQIIGTENVKDVILFPRTPDRLVP
jgi:nondiscriminating aspartyl-tRNA synthetase